MRRFLIAIFVLAAVTVMAFPMSEASAAGGGRSVFNEEISIVVEPIVVSPACVSVTEIRPGDEVKIVYTIRNYSSQKHYFVFCDIRVPQNCLIGARWTDTREDYIPGTEFLVPSQYYRTLEITVSPNLDLEGEFPIRVEFFRTRSTEGMG
ncbi:MAG: hypothetical protein WC514_03440 [Candidatus Paceibacterota bacterium]